MQKLIFTNEVARELSGLIAAANPHGVYVLADSNTAMLVWPLFSSRLSGLVGCSADYCSGGRYQQES